ncbi:MAG: response regulator transcription factor [Bacteroidetes bacterium]|nr:response regulator transcription factor [Bacteroidota bacterium]MBU1579762.1 response regulator transcription factor [Bacteroidota bacterium]MBU2556762.1 response regulator transcription factor [Bacteroidota bacterium]
MNKIKILIADDHQLFREGLVTLLTDSDQIEVVGQAENGIDAIDKADKLKPDIIIMDIGMPTLNGIEATKIIKKNQPEVKIIALSMHAEKSYIKQMLGAGAKGYVQKNCAIQKLIEGIHTVNSGNIYLSESITEALVEDYLEYKKEDDQMRLFESLTSREMEILILVASGKSTGDIAEELFVSVKTIGTHKHNILEKLQLKTTADLVKFALRHNLINMD